MRRSAALLRDARGVTIVEFAAILPVLCVVLLAIFDLGYRSYVGSVVQGSLHEAARMATVGGITGEEIEAHVKKRLTAFSKDAEVVTAQSSYQDFSNVGQPERIVQDTYPFGEYNEGDCFEDANGNGIYDYDQGRSGLGGAEDIVRFEVSITYDRLFPLGGFLGWPTTQTVSGNTVLRNQPFAARVGGARIIC